VRNYWTRTMKFPTSNRTVVIVAVLACATAVWCVERLRPADRPRYQYFEDSTKNGHYIVEVDTITGHVKRVPSASKYASFQHELKQSRIDVMGLIREWTADQPSPPFTPDVSRIDWLRTTLLLTTFAAIGFAAVIAMDARRRKVIQQ
jgi:hypothetical protein